MVPKGTTRPEREPLAIVGIGFRACNAAGPAQLWKLLREGRDVVGTVPAERWEDVYDPNPLALGKSVTRWGSFLDQVDGFDWRFFGVSPKQAANMDPQHRLLLEVAWEAIEDAGMPMAAVAGTRAGVFVGMMFNDYGRLYGRNLRALDGYTATANTFAHAANRISFFLDLRGPSLATDTNCSASLVAVHQACQSIWRRESAWALAGGVSLILAPDVDVSMSKASALSPTGRCRTWDAKADGFVRGEGAGVVVLKTLSRALADGDRIYCVVLGTAANHVGRGSWIMEPSSVAQRDVILEACKDAGVSGKDLDYVEIHGTGTLKGDPIEAEGLGAATALGRSSDEPCGVGSIKTNLGHLDAAAGVAGLIKTALCISHRELVPSLHFETPNPEIDLERLKLRVQTRVDPWPVRSHAPTAGVTAIGFGGTNAHVVLRGITHRTGQHGFEGLGHLLVLSARTEEARRDLAERYACWLEDLPVGPQPIYDLCYTAAARRTHHGVRLAVTGDSADVLASKLRSYLSGDAHDVHLGQAPTQGPRRVLFVFPGHGPQWLGMAQDLFGLPPFRETMAKCDQWVRAHAGWSIIDELFADPERSRLEQSDVVQPVLFSLAVSLAQVWQSWGVEPDAVIGHSFGELAAAHVAGAIGLRDAIRIVCARGRVTRQREGRGGVAVVELSNHDVLPILERYSGLEVGGANSPTSTIVTGATEDLEAFLADMDARGVFARRVKLAYASHSRDMEAVLDDFAREIGTVNAKASRIPIHSTVRGGIADGGSFDATYWMENLRRPVRFAEALATMGVDGDVFFEISPHPVLVTAIEQACAGRGVTAIASLRRGIGGVEALNSALARGYAAGCEPAWARRYPPGNVTTTPTYAWQRERAWLNLSEGVEDTREEAAAHPLLGRHIEMADQTAHLWDGRIGGMGTAFSHDHRLEGVPVLPASAFIEMIVSAASGVLGTSALELLDLELPHALFLPEKGAYHLQLTLRRDPRENGYRARVSGRRDDGKRPWQVHATARVVAGDASSLDDRVDVSAPAGGWTTKLSSGECYARLRSIGLDYGPAFQGIEQLWRGGDELLATVRVPDGLDLDSYYFHPAFHDACLHAAALTESVQARSGILPVRIARIALRARPTATVSSYARIVDVGERVRADVLLTSGDGEVIQRVEGIEFASLDPFAKGDLPTRDWLYELGWAELSAPAAQAANAPVEPGSTWLVLADSAGVGDAIADRIQSAGGRPIVVRRGHAYRQTSDTTFEVRTHVAQDVRDVVACIHDRSVPLAGVLHLWSLDLPSVDEIEIADLDTAILSTCGSTAAVLRALEETRPQGKTPMWLVTRGAQAYGLEANEMSPLQSPLWGLGRSLAHELPWRWGGLVDLDPQEEADFAATALWASLALAIAGDDEIVLRRRRAFGARLNRVPGPAQLVEAAFDATTAYLVTGGTGGLGLAVARWLAVRGARHLVLAARTPLPGRDEWNAIGSEHPAFEKVKALQQIEALGVRVDTWAVDVADPTAVGRCLEEHRLRGLPRIGGVFHLAGTVELVDLLQLDDESLLGPTRSKIHATLVLQRQLADVDTFVLFSSASAIIRSPRLAHYAAANAFLDGMAHRRRALGLPGLAINWGLWSDVGYARRLGRTQGPSSIRAMQGIAPNVGIRILEQLVAGSDVQTLVWPSSWDEWARLYPAFGKSHMVAHLRETGPTASAEVPTARAIPATDRPPPILRGYVRELVASQLNLEQSAIPEDRPLEQLGLDSLSATEMRNQIRHDFDVKIPLVHLLGSATISTITETILESLGGMAEGGVTAGAEGTGTASPTDGDGADEIGEIARRHSGVEVVAKESVSSDGDDGARNERGAAG